MITVITPTIPTREELLAECRQSVKEQTMPVQHEIIWDYKKAGAPHIRNQAVKDAKTDWVLFLDDDDVLLPQHIEKIAPYFDDYDVVMSWPTYIDGLMEPYWLWKEFSPDILDEWCPWGQCAAVRRSSYLAAGGQPEDVVYEDWALWLRLRDNGARFKVVPEVLWKHRIHPGQRTITDLQDPHKKHR